MEDFKDRSRLSKAVLRTIKIFSPKPGTSENDELELLLILVKHFEDRHVIIPRN